MAMVAAEWRRRAQASFMALPSPRSGAYQLAEVMLTATLHLLRAAARRRVR